MLCDRTLKCILDAFLMPGGTTVKLRRAIERLQASSCEIRIYSEECTQLRLSHDPQGLFILKSR